MTCSRDTVGVAPGATALFAGLGRGVLDGFDATGLVVGSAGTTTVSYSRWGLIPKVDAAGEDAFGTYHRRSALLKSGTVPAVAVALVASHLG